MKKLKLFSGLLSFSYDTRSRSGRGGGPFKLLFNTSCHCLFQCHLSVASLLLLLLVVTQPEVVNTNKVEIIIPYHPLYVQSGSTLKLVCNTTRRDVQWLRATPDTLWNDEVVAPSTSNQLRVETWKEEPSGNVSSTLFKQNVQVRDRGTYTCRSLEKDLQFAIWVTPVKILTGFTRVKSEGSHMQIECNITGFDSNAPNMKYYWYYNNTIIDVERSKYTVTSRDTNSKLHVNEAGKGDSGIYHCEFSLPTSIGAIFFKEAIHIKESDLPLTSQASTTCSISLSLFILIFCLHGYDSLLHDLV